MFPWWGGSKKLQCIISISDNVREWRGGRGVGLPALPSHAQAPRRSSVPVALTSMTLYTPPRTFWVEFRSGLFLPFLGGFLGSE